MLFRLSLPFLCFLLVACSDSDNNNDTNSNPYEGYSSTLYAAPDNWLCRPDISGDANACEGDLSSTIVFADGSTQFEASPVGEDQTVDCFYVYPTTSGDISLNSDLVAGAEIATTFVQAARYRSVCRLYAPLYRQLTLPGLLSALVSPEPDINDELVSAFDFAYSDVLDAFQHYVSMAEGRGFILIGHSQGSGHLTRLIQEEIETDPYLSKRMIAAHLIGVSVALPNDAEIGATFAVTPPCSFDEDTGCLVNFSSFRVDVPPSQTVAEENEVAFGITDSVDTRAACTHPVDLGAGSLPLDAYFSPAQVKPYSDDALNAQITTPFVKVPGLLQGECIEQNGQGYLAISQNAMPADPRTDDIGGDSLPDWGLHVIDVSLAQGDLVRLAERQAESWLSQ